MLKVTLSYALVISVAVIKTIGYRLENHLNITSLDWQDYLGDANEIVGGDVVDIKQYPYLVSVYHIYMKGLICGGSILSERYVLSAGHCHMFCIGCYQLRVGSSYYAEEGYTYSVSNVTMHPQFNKNTLDYDISIWTPTEKIALNGVTIKTVKLPDIGSVLHSGANIIVIGWGRTSESGNVSEVLRAVTVPVTTEEYCSSAFNDTITERMFCAGFVEGGKDACYGYSGSPAVSAKNLVQYGIVSFGNGCARPGKPGGYTNITVLRDWIQNITGI